MLDIVETLEHLTLFSGLSHDLLVDVAERHEQISLSSGDILFRKGDPGDAMFLVESGKLSIFINDEDGNQKELNRVSTGQAIGEMSVIDVEPRTASVVAAEATTLLKFSHTDFMEVFADQPQELLAELREVSNRLRLGYLDILKELPLFSDLPDAVIGKLAVNLEPMSLDPEQLLFSKGDPGDALYIISSGKVKIVTEDASGEELILNQCDPGEYIGDMSLIDDQPRSAGVVALEASELLKLGREEFLYVLTEHPEVAMDVYRNISRRLRFATTYIEQTIEWAKRIGEGDYDSAMEQIKDSQSDIKSTAQAADEARAAELLSAFFTMVKGVQEREEKLKSQLRQLTIKIDEAQANEEFEALTSTDFFAELKASAKRIREENQDG